MLALALPALLTVLLLIVLPVGWLAWQSIYQDGFTLENYRRILIEDVYWRTFLFTFEISLLVTGLALLLGYPLAYAAHACRKAGASSSSGAGGAAVLDQRAGARLCVAGAAAADRRRSTSCCKVSALISEPLALVHNTFGTVDCHRAHPAAFHGAAALRRDAENPGRSDAGRREPWRHVPSTPSGASFCRCHCPAYSPGRRWCSCCASASTSRPNCWAAVARSWCRCW